MNKYKVLPYKTYNRIGHFSKSRLGDGDHYIDQKTEDICLKQIVDPLTLIIVQEKLDGSNVCVLNTGDEIVALSRSGYRCDTSNLEQHRAFAQWVRFREERFTKLLPFEGNRVVGEWLLQAHGTKYNICDSEDLFVPFDWFMRIDDNQELRVNYHLFLNKVLPLGFRTPHLFHVGGACSINRTEKMAKYYDFPIINQDSIEGFIYRIEVNGEFKNIVKYVRPNKIDGKYFIDFPDQPIWNFNPNSMI